MIIKKKVKLGNTNYFITVNCEYKNKDGRTYLCLKNSTDDYFDGGDLSILIEKIETNYSDKVLNKYNSDIMFIRDCLYIYDYIPFISYVGDIYLSNDNIISSTSSISKEELDEYIKINGIAMNDNNKFKLGDFRTWNI